MLISYNQALSQLKQGELVIVPTETVYGLAARIDNIKSVERIFHIKKRPLSDPLIVHCSDSDQIAKYSENLDKISLELLNYFSPGPLTLLLNKSSLVSDTVTGSSSKACFRIPQHKLLLKLLKDLQVPLAAPSANFFSYLSPTCAKDAFQALGEQVPVLDGGDSQEGIESTILEVRDKDIFILRPGTITKEILQDFLNQKNLDYSVQYQERDKLPGSCSSHYKPSQPFYILETKDESFLDIQFPQHTKKELVLNSSAKKTAQTLYKNLRQLSNDKKNTLLFVKKNKTQKGFLWYSIWNRLERACAEKF